MATTPYDVAVLAVEKQFPDEHVRTIIYEILDTLYEDTFNNGHDEGWTEGREAYRAETDAAPNEDEGSGR